MSNTLQAQGMSTGRTWTGAQWLPAVSWEGRDGRERWSAEVVVEVLGLGWVSEGEYCGLTCEEAERKAKARVATLLRGLCV